MLRYAISDGSLALGHRSGSSSSLMEHAAWVAARQIDFFLLRETTLPAGELAARARDLHGIFANTRTRLLIHSRADVAVATRAQGVHLPAAPGQVSPSHVRTLYTRSGLPTPVVSLSCHTEAELRGAAILQPDLILFGPIFGKQVEGAKIHPGIGLEALGAACSVSHPVPVLALGGVSETDIPACLEAGAAGVAGIRLFQPQTAPQR